MMTIYHTSPDRISEISKNGLFGSFLCFADKPYYMTQSEKAVCYELDIDEDDLVEASHLFHHENAATLAPIVQKVHAILTANDLGVSEDDVEELLSERISLWDCCGNTEADTINDLSFDLQKYTAECAVALGFKGARMTDEQGSLFMIDMYKNEKMLIAA